jgi:hypothetical protein
MLYTIGSAKSHFKHRHKIRKKLHHIGQPKVLKKPQNVSFKYRQKVGKCIVIDQKFYAELKKVYFMGSEMQPGVITAQKRNLLVMKFL